MLQQYRVHWRINLLSCIHSTETILQADFGVCSSPLFSSNGSLLQVPIICHLCFVDDLACCCERVGACDCECWLLLRVELDVHWGNEECSSLKGAGGCLSVVCRHLYCGLIEFNEKFTVKIESRDLFLLFHRRSPCYVVCVLLSVCLCRCTRTSCAYWIPKCLWVTLCQMKRSFITAIGSNLSCRTVSPTSSSVSAALIWCFDRLPGECER